MSPISKQISHPSVPGLPILTWVLWMFLRSFICLLHTLRKVSRDLKSFKNWIPIINSLTGPWPVQCPGLGLLAILTLEHPKEPWPAQVGPLPASVTVRMGTHCFCNCCKTWTKHHRPAAYFYFPSNGFNFLSPDYTNSRLTMFTVCTSSWQMSFICG